jgi:hypothetical protein
LAGGARRVAKIDGDNGIDPVAATSHDSTHRKEEWNFCKLLLL